MYEYRSIDVQARERIHRREREAQMERSARRARRRTAAAHEPVLTLAVRNGVPCS